jgi:nicotinamidase-related amidase
MSIRIHSEQSQILVVDIQARLAPHLHNVELMLKRSVQVLSGAKLFNIPISVAEQYPQGLGHSVDEIQAFIVEPVYEKTTFSCFGSPHISKRVRSLGEKGHTTLIIFGCEAHVCVLQTVIDAIDQGYKVVVIDDAVTSRNPRDAELARVRLSGAGADYVSTEMLLFEWTQGKEAEQFKAVSALVK